MPKSLLEFLSVMWSPQLRMSPLLSEPVVPVLHNLTYILIHAVPGSKYFGHIVEKSCAHKFKSDISGP